MASGVALVVARLRLRREEIVRAVFAHVREAVPDQVGLGDAAYVEGLRATVAAAVDYALAGIEPAAAGRPGPVPVAAVAQAHRAARLGVSVETVLRRYVAGHALVWDYVLEEAARVDQVGVLREMSRAQASLLDRLVIAVAREHVEELERAGRSHEQHLSERVRALLAGERRDGAELGYDLDGEHLGVIGRGAACKEALRGVAQGMGRRLLCVGRGGGMVWAWLGGAHGLQMLELELAVAAQKTSGGDLAFAVGEPARGFEGWRLTHRQAQAAFLVTLRKPQRLTRYADVALLATALKDEALARALIDIHISPLEHARDGGQVLRETLRAYLAAERNVSSTAAALGVVRNTVENRLRTIEERLGRPLRQCPAELEIALHLDELTHSTRLSNFNK